MTIAARPGVDPGNELANPVPDWDGRFEKSGDNKFADRKFTPYWEHLAGQLKEKITLLLFMGTLGLVVKGTFGHGPERTEAFAESGFWCITVVVFVNLAAWLNWKRGRMFEALTKHSALSNLRVIVCNGHQMEVTDADIGVDDVVSFNAHMASIIARDGLLLSGQDVRCDESALTGEPEPTSKSFEKPYIVLGTTVNAGKGAFLVVAVGENYTDGAELSDSVLNVVRKDAEGFDCLHDSQLCHPL